MCARRSGLYGTRMRERRLIGNRHADRQAVVLHNGRSKKPGPGSPPPPPHPARGQMAAEESEQAAAALSHATPQQMHRLFIEK